jgi:hypothetical protein
LRRVGGLYGNTPPLAIQEHSNKSRSDLFGKVLTTLCAISLFYGGWYSHGSNLLSNVICGFGHCATTSSFIPTAWSIDNVQVSSQSGLRKIADLVGSPPARLPERIAVAGAIKLPGVAVAGGDIGVRAVVQVDYADEDHYGIADNAVLNPDTLGSGTFRPQGSANVRPVLDGLTVLTPQPQSPDEKQVANQRRLEFATGGFDRSPLWQPPRPITPQK